MDLQITFADDLYIEHKTSSKLFGLIKSDKEEIHHFPHALTPNDISFVNNILSVAAVKKFVNELNFDPFKKPSGNEQKFLRTMLQ